MILDDENQKQSKAAYFNGNEKKTQNIAVRKVKRKRRDKTDLGPDFVAPDAGWAWIVCLATGLSTFCVFTPVQQYGIIHRQRLYDLGFNAKQITTIVNSELATAALTGIIQGPLFRRFTYRQAAIAGGVLVFLGTLLTAFCETFWHYFICFSVLYGFGLGTNLSATALALNTYFKKYRRRALGFSSTIIGLGPIILPHICTFLLEVYGTQGTILLVAAFSLNTLVCGLTLQPVKWHVKTRKCKKNELNEHTSQEQYEEKINLTKKEEKETEEYQCKYCQDQRQTLKNIELRGSQYEIYDAPLTPILARVNDDWYGSRISLSSFRSKDSSFKSKSRKSDVSEIETQMINFNKAKYTAHHCTCVEELKELRMQTEHKLTENQEQNFGSELKVNPKKTFKEKLIKFFDLDLLSDLTFLNLIQGMTIMMFCELNFSFLTPFILASYGYNNEKISLAMSLLAGVDIIVRFTAPLALEKVKVGNNVIFAVGIVILLIGRISVTIVDSYFMTLLIFLFMGFGKGFRTISASLIIPSYVPLNRLPGASGLQLVFNALFTMAFGPILGLIADVSSYTFTIHLLNLMTVLSLLLWIVEWFITRTLRKSCPNGPSN